MPYTQLTLGALSTQLGILLDDQNGLYWPAQDKYYAIWEGLRVWGSITNYWRSRGSFSLDPTQSSPYYDLSVVLPALRPRTWTLGDLTKEIQYMCLEAANGISGAGMSGQISVTSILQSIQRARNRFVIDARFPYSLLAQPSPPPPQGTIDFAETGVYVHRAAWQNEWSGVWTNLWREDAWSIDKSSPDWTLEPGTPRTYSESELSPLTLQLAPPPVDAGTLEIIAVESLLVDLSDPAATFDIPDEWIHAVKYAALADIFSSESQNKDPVRAQYAEMRYMQAMDFARDARSINRLMLNGVPLPIDSFAAIDAGLPFWRNQAGRPMLAGVMYDFLAFAPVCDQAYGVTADVVQSAPIPAAPGDFIPLGAEDIPNLLDYATHVLTFKCGGKELQDSFAQYDSFLGAAAARGRINAAKIRYLTPLFGQPQKEQEERPDRLEKEKTGVGA